MWAGGEPSCDPAAGGSRCQQHPQCRGLMLAYKDSTGWVVEVFGRRFELLECEEAGVQGAAPRPGARARCSPGV